MSTILVGLNNETDNYGLEDIKWIPILRSPDVRIHQVGRGRVDTDEHDTPRVPAGPATPVLGHVKNRKGGYSRGLTCINRITSAISGPFSRPVTALRSGMNNPRPLRPVASFTALVHAPHVVSS